MKLETERLILREVTMDDFDSWYEILSDADTMKYYQAPFDKEKVKKWINWNIDNYATYGFGLWSVVLKETGNVIGDCGITMQNIHGQKLPEIGYHINKKYQRKGYAAEASQRCMKYFFEKFDFPKLYSYMKYTNKPSYSTAENNGFTFVEQYEDPINTYTKVYAITREEWKNKYIK